MSFLQKVFLFAFFLSAFCLPQAVLCAAEQSSSTASQQEPGFPYTGLVTGGDVNLRSGPGRSYEILSQLARGAKLQVVAKQQSWLAVTLPEGIPAYIHRSLLRESREGLAEVNGTNVQVRARPSQSASRWGELSSPDRVRVLEFHGEWAKVQPPPFCRGWISAEYVAFYQKEQKQGGTDDHDRGLPQGGVEGGSGAGSQTASERRPAAGTDAGAGR